MTWPMVIGVLSLMSFQLVDSIFIGRLGVEPLAVVGYTIPIYQLVIGFQVGIGIATTALISQRLGAGKEHDARALGGTILIFGSFTIALLCLFIWLFRHIVLGALGAEASLTPLAEELWSVFLVAALCGAILYFGYSICRAHGNTMLPGVGMVFTSLLNMALDPLFIFYFELGLAGAAWATLASFLAGFLLIFPKTFANHWLGLASSLQQFLMHVRETVSISLPAMVSQMMPAIAAIMATYLVSSFGTEVVAAWGMGVRLEFFGIVLVLALTMSMPPMIGRFYGAGDILQIKALVALGVKFVIAWQIVFAILLAIFASPLSHLMAGKEAVAIPLFWIVMILPISYAPLGVCMLCVSICNAIAAPQRALTISFLRLFICYLPFLFAGSLIADFEGLIVGATLGNFCAGLLAWRLYQVRIKKASEQMLSDRGSLTTA